MNDPIVERLRDQAEEVARPEHAGWADTMIAAADEITRLREKVIACEADYLLFDDTWREITRLRELVAGQDDGGHWYSQASMDAVVRERDQYRDVLKVVAKGAYTLSIMQSMARDALGDA